MEPSQLCALRLRPLTHLHSPLQQVIPTANAVSLEDDGDYARFENRGKEALDFMLIEAEPTRESVVARVRRKKIISVG